MVKVDLLVEGILECRGEIVCVVVAVAAVGMTAVAVVVILVVAVGRHARLCLGRLNFRKL